MDTADYGLALRAARKAQRLSVARAAKLVGISPATLKRWESGQGLPRRAELIEVLDLYYEPPESPYRALISEGHAPTGSREETELRHSGVAFRLLRARRRQLGLSLSDIATATGISAPSLHRYETGTRGPSESHLALIAAALKMTSSELAALSRARVPGEPDEISENLVPLFLDASGRGPVATYIALDRLAKFREPDTVAAGNIVHGLMLMGDHEGLAENWAVLRRAFPKSQQADENLIRAITSLAIVRARLGHAVDYPRLRSLVRTLPPEEGFAIAMLNLIRAASYSGEVELALTLLSQVEEYAARRDSVLLFQTGLHRLIMAPSTNGSERTLDCLERLRDEAPSDLHRYLANVAIADRANSIGATDAYQDAILLCTATEALTGLGSPLIRGLR